jgi:prevent-host-death family protein
MEQSMASVSASEFAKNFGQFRDVAQREAVAITSHGRESCYLISAEEYRRLKQRDRDVFNVTDMPDDIIEAIGAVRMDPRHDHLNALLDD